MTDEEIEIRPELAAFVKKMEAALKENDYKSEWQDMTNSRLLSKINEKVDMLQEEHTLIMRCPHKPIKDHTETMSKIAIHLANYCMFLNHNYPKKKTTKRQWKYEDHRPLHNL